MAMMMMLMMILIMLMMTVSLMSLSQECPHVKRERAGKIEGHVQSQLGVRVMSSLRKMMNTFFCKNKDG